MKDNDTEVTQENDPGAVEVADSDTAIPDAAETETEAAATEAPVTEAAVSKAQSKPSDAGTTGSSSVVSTLRSPRVIRWAAAVVIVGLLVVTGVSLWQMRSLQTQLDAERSQNADALHAQQVAADYAVAAAHIDYRNFDPWFASLRRGVNDRLAGQFSSSEPALRDLLGQLQWTSTGSLVGSDITAQHDGKYEVQVFVDVTTSNVQSPQGVKTTALYPITIEKNGWRISDISGGVAPIPGK